MHRPVTIRSLASLMSLSVLLVAGCEQSKKTSNEEAPIRQG